MEVSDFAGTDPQVHSRVDGVMLLMSPTKTCYEYNPAFLSLNGVLRRSFISVLKLEPFVVEAGAAPVRLILNLLFRFHKFVVYVVRYLQPFIVIFCSLCIMGSRY